jgi:ATP-dependent DNA helicase RecQ
VVFPDSTLVGIAQSRPGTLDALAAVNGVGAKKLDQYGDEVLHLVAASAGTGSDKTREPPAPDA